LQQEKWILCSVCDNKTRLKIREDTEIRKHYKNYELLQGNKITKKLYAKDLVVA